MQNGLNVQRYGLDLGFSAMQFFGGFFLSYVTGTEKSANSVELSQTQYALETELGYKIPSWNDMRFWAGLHIDSGDKDSTDGDNETYDSFYYDLYGKTGRMDFVRWGNLTSVKAGFDVQVFTGFTVGAEFFKLSKTEENDSSINFGDGGQFIKANLANITFNSTDTEIGDEFDLWIDYQLPSGMKVGASVSSFFPGSALSQATTTTGVNMRSTIFQVLSQVSIFF